MHRAETNTDHVTEALARVRTAWTPERARLAQAQVQRRLARSTRLRRLAGGAVLGAVVVVGGAVLWRWPAAPSVFDPAATIGGGNIVLAPTEPTSRPVRLSDGTTATPFGSDSAVQVSALSSGRRTMKVVRGAAAFDIVPGGAPFQVDVGDVRVEVLGTAFTVEQVGERARVAVRRGLVRVSWPGGSRELTSGEAGVFPPLPPPVAAPAAAPGAAQPAYAQVPAASAATGGSSWRTLAARGRFDEAYRALRKEGSSAVPDEPAAILEAADVARLSGHPDQAVPRLRQLLDRYPRDPRSPLAAFTLGLVLLEELGRPRDAADAFGRARALDPQGDLAQDALAREVEALFRAGDAARAREKADEYVRRHPTGRRLRSVRRYGGLASD